jgi:hypothetical protein
MRPTIHQNKYLTRDEWSKEVQTDSSLSKQVAGAHYKNFTIQPVQFIHANNIPFMEGNAIKYLCRWREKGGVQDLEKAKHYIEMLIELESKKNGGDA